MSRLVVIVALLFVFVAGGFTLAVAQDATPEANVLGTPCATVLAEASPMGSPMAMDMASPMAMDEGTPVVTGCATPEMGMMDGTDMATPTS